MAQDTFAGRTVTSGWGIASDGNSWTEQTAGQGSSLSVSGNEGILTGSNSSNSVYMTLGNATASNVDLVVRYRSKDYAYDEGHVMFDWANSSTYYTAGIDGPVDGSMLDIYKAKGSSEVEQTQVPFPATNGTAYWEEIQVTTAGPAVTISIRAWQDGTAKPSSWGLVWTDSSGLAAGKVGINGWDDGLGWQMDHFTATNLSSGSPAAFIQSLPRPARDALALLVLGWLIAAAYFLIPRFRPASSSAEARPRHRSWFPRAGRRGRLRSLHRGRRSM